MPNAPSTTSPQTAEPVSSASQPSRRGSRRLRWLAAGLGIVAAGLAIAVPVLPVVSHETAISWPDAAATDGRVGDVTAPLTALQPLRLSASVPCELARDTSGTLFATVPPNSPIGAGKGMTLASDGSRVVLTNRGRELSAGPIPPGDCVIELDSDDARTTFAIGGLEATTTEGDVRPQLTGLYTDLTGPAPDGLRITVDVDNRYDTSPHPLKLIAIVLAVLAAAASLLVLHRLDRMAAGHGPLRLVPRGWWRPGPRDLVVVGVLAVWSLIGAITSDDGYILAIAQARESAGYIGNYYRWMNAPEAPFGWFYELYAVMVQVSTATPWLRLPALLLGILCWWLISRAVLPRLGRAVRLSNAAGWAAAAVFLCWWLPYDNGLRPEPVAAAGSLLTLCLVERTIATRRFVPLGVALLVAALTVTSTPTGLIALVPFLVSVRPLVDAVRARGLGWLAVLAPLAGCGLLVLVVVFADQSTAAVLEATRVRQVIGPSLSWYEEPYRYLQLFGSGLDGTLSRRFPVLLLLLCVGTCLVVLLRRSRIPGAALGPSRRLIGLAAGSLLIIALTPTKWTHHFGAFAAIGAALAALTALATSGSVLRSRRNRAMFVAALLVLLAFSFTGTNGWWYVSGIGVPWFDRSPSIRGFELTNLLMAAAVVAAVVAVVEHLRLPTSGTARKAAVAAAAARPPRRLRALRLGSAPLAVICGAIVLFELLSIAKGMHKERDAYSFGATNVAAFAGRDCGLTDYVRVERDPAQGVLNAVPGLEPPLLDGFGPNAAELGTTDRNKESGPPYRIGARTGTAVPMWGSMLPDRGTGTMRTAWYRLDDRARRGEAPLVVTVGGPVFPGNEVHAEFGRLAGDSAVVPVETVAVPFPGGTESRSGEHWVDHRLLLTGRPAAGADVVRLTVTDNDTTAAGWLAVAAPRVPVVTPMREVLAEGPSYLQWPVPFVHPCVRPFAIRGGVAQAPAFLIAPDRYSEGTADGWAEPDTGGVQAFVDVLARRAELPSYIDEGPGREWGGDRGGFVAGNWGRVFLLDPFDPAPPATVGTTDRTRWGLWSPGRMRT